MSARIPTASIIFSALLAPLACSENPVGPSRPAIVAGQSTVLLVESVSQGGGIVSVDRPGDALDGLEIDVPIDAYDEPRTIRIASSPIERHELGADFNPLTPLISISNGGGYADAPMTITIPCTVPDGHFAMAFVYDRETRSLEGMPLAAVADSSITVMTSHFAFSSIASLDKTTGGIEVGESEIVVSSIPESRLDEPFNSGFVPGVDDWQFTNYGSYVYSGHCAGQSSTMMWYYSDRKERRGDPPLYGRFDNDGGRTTPKIWADDVAGYRFCGLAQVELPWNTWFQSALKRIESTLSEKVTYNLFAYSIRLTKQPQFVHVLQSPSDVTGGHAMVIYKIANGNLYIADPNYPSRTDRWVEFSRDRFLPYYSGPNASQLGVAYKTFYYLAQSSIINSSLFKQRWAEVIEGSIAQEKFPSYRIHARVGNGPMIPLVDEFETETGLFEVDVRADVPLKVTAVYDDDENRVSFANDLVKLPFGEHLLGFHVTDMENRWVGFEWITVRSKDDATIDPPPNASETGTDCSAFLMIDSVGTLVTETVYSKYPDGVFTFTAQFPGGGARISATNFRGAGTYPLYTHPQFDELGSYVVWHNGQSWYGSGSMTITRWDVEKVAGTFLMRQTDGAGKIINELAGQFQCNR